jgi:hypothetical protein
MKRHERTDFANFDVGHRVKGIAGGWEGQTGTVIFFYMNNLEIRLDSTGEDVGVPAEDFEIIPGRGWEALVIKYNEPGSEWQQVGLDEAIKDLEGGGYWKKGTAQHMLEAGQVLHTPFAQYKIIFMNEAIAMQENPEMKFMQAVEAELRMGNKHNKVSMEKLAKIFDIDDKTKVKELIELAIVNRARFIAHRNTSLEQRYKDIVELYDNQVTLSHRTSQSILLQQYSTPAPIGFLAGIFCQLDKLESKGGYAFEPSAGNGLLTIAANPERVYVNEVDDVRNKNLQTQGFANVWKRDATQPFFDVSNHFVAVITNPPFGRLDHAISFDGFPIKTLDHLMAIRALETMTGSGRAAIIVGGHRRWDNKGRIQAGQQRIFYNYLYNHYYVSDVIMINGQKLYSRQGTSFPTELILIAGRKTTPSGAAPLFDHQKDKQVNTFEELFDRVMDAMQSAAEVESVTEIDIDSLRRKALALKNRNANQDPDDLGAPYEPASQSCFRLDTQVPDSMSFEIQSALQRIKQDVGGDIDNFVRHRLGFKTKIALCKALSAEQIDAVALAIYNIEAREQGMIIGDQTGIGKGRVAASMIRYGVQQGLRPIFITEKANLFSDIYRDLAAIGSSHLRPFIVNARESKTDIKDEDGNVVYQALPVNDQERVFLEQMLPAGYDFIVGTYSQFNSPDKKPQKPAFLMAVAEGNIMVMDESHNSSGLSNTGEFLQRVVSKTKGVVYLSATFAKRPDNMPIYAMKTAIREANMSKEELVEAIFHGGVALQEVLSSQLVAEGQMIRRERSFEGVEVNYITLDELKTEHEAIADNITAILRDIIGFQETHVDGVVQQMDDIVAAEGKEIGIREGTSQAGVDNIPYFSKVFNVINQMLFSIKAEAVADRAIQRLKEGKKPVIAFASTMGSFIEQMENERGMPVSDGDTINADFSEVLLRGLQGVMRYTVKDIDGSPTYKTFDISELSPDAQITYQSILEKIQSVSTGISISPIDVVKQRIEAAGYSVAEVTGRKYSVQLNSVSLNGNDYKAFRSIKKSWGKSEPQSKRSGYSATGLVASRKKINTNDAFRQFNNNEVDVLMINQSGSTGASAHAVPTAKVPKEQVKQRVMIVLQAELDINTEVQKRGRINRTGQILKPIYDYIISSVPAEKRLMMMLQKKLKSLDANTTSNQRQSTKILDVPDFLNKYGDKVVREYLLENEEIDNLLGKPLAKNKADKDETVEDAAHKVSGRVAVLPVKMQQEFYDEITERYNDYVEYLKQVDEYDLEVETMNLQAETTNTSVVKMGKGGESAFGEDSVLETVWANVLKKPFTAKELDNIIIESLGGKDAKTVTDELLERFRTYVADRLQQEITQTEAKYTLLIKSIPNEKKIQKILEKEGQAAWMNAINEKEKELLIAKAGQLEMVEKTFANRSQYLESIFKFFYPGRRLNYPFATITGQELIPAVCIGILIDQRKKNPYTLSAVKVKLAIANSAKYIALPASYSEKVTSIMGVSSDLETTDKDTLMMDWVDAIRQRATDRAIRHIITGNLLQAFSDYQGKLVSYTTKEGEVKKGILMPEHWTMEDRKQQGMVVPIYNARKIVASTVQGNSVITNNGMSIIRVPDGFRIIVAGSRERGGHFYLDEDLLKLVNKNNFEKVSDQMVAIVPEANLTSFLEILQRKHNVSITITKEQEPLLEKNKLSRTIKPIVLPPPEEAGQAESEEYTIPPMEILRLRAKALLLKRKYSRAA